MDKRKRFTVVFVLGCVAAAIAFCIVTTYAGLRLIYWYLGNCGEGFECFAAGWLIDYWWAVFVPASIVAAVILRQVHDHRLAKITRE